MPNLSASLKGKDLGFLGIVAELWGIELVEGKNTKSVGKDLIAQLLQPELIQELIDNLPGEPQAALSDLVSHRGRIPWSLFTKRYGEVREMGAARRDREKPHLNDNAAPSESLWYRSLVARSFFDTAAGPEEFAYIPEDLLESLPLDAYPPARHVGRPASISECARIIPTNDWIIDDLCTVLAGIRTGVDEQVISGAIRISFEHTGISVSGYIDLLIDLLTGLDLMDKDKMPSPEPIRSFLEAERGRALQENFFSWKVSSSFNELHQIPGLGIEGEWTNDPFLTRQTILDFLSRVPGYPGLEDSQDGGTWWSLSALVDDIKQLQPDFQRPAGDYDSWYIRDLSSGEYLRGFKHWEAVDGKLVRFMVAGPLYWLGFVDLAVPENAQPERISEVTAFRFSGWAGGLLEDQAPAGTIEEDEKLVIKSDARLHAPEGVPRTLRYQAARFCSWEGYNKGRYNYRITPESLERASKKELTVDHLLALFNRFDCDIPPNLVKALKGWEAHGTQARFDRKYILKVGNPEILDQLRGTRAARFFGETLGPTSVEIQSGAVKNIEGALVELGYLGEIKLDEDQ